MTQIKKPDATAAIAAETPCRRCTVSPCACRRGVPAPRVGFDGLLHGTDLPRIRWIDWIEYAAVMALVWLAVVRPPLPGWDGGGCAAA